METYDKRDKRETVLLIAAFFIFLGVFRWPYGYYLFIRYVVTIVTIYLAIRALIKKEKILAVLNLVLCCLFQPFYKVIADRAFWQFMDIVVVVWIGMMCAADILEDDY